MRHLEQQIVDIHVNQVFRETGSLHFRKQHLHTFVNLGNPVLLHSPQQSVKTLLAEDIPALHGCAVFYFRKKVLHSPGLPQGPQHPGIVFPYAFPFPSYFFDKGEQGFPRYRL